MDESKRTKPKPRGADSSTDPALLSHGRYGTDDTISIWGPERTMQFSLDAQAAAARTMSELHPDIIPPEHAKEITDAAKLANASIYGGLKAVERLAGRYPEILTGCVVSNLRRQIENDEFGINPFRIRELEAKGSHDVIAINTALQERISAEAAAHVNKARTSADTTETAKALQNKLSLVVVIDSLQNLRDILLEQMKRWKVPHMDVTHFYDALPTLAGRPFAFYAETLQTGIDKLAEVYANSVRGKWADATGNHHSAVSLGIDGMELQKKYCEGLGIGWMTAPAQIPAREFLFDIISGMARNAGTLENIARYVRTGRGDDTGIFVVPKGAKGSSGMPHKNAKGGNPIKEEQSESYWRFMTGQLATAHSSIQFDYARDLTASASDRIMFDDVFKWGDHSIRELARAVYVLELVPERCIERVQRSYGVVTSEQLMTYLTDQM